MNDYYLKFDSQDAGEAALITAGVLIVQTNAVGETRAIPAELVNYDPVGTIYKETGEFDADWLPISAPVDGWHCNLRIAGALPPSLEPFAMTPVTPARVWA